MDDSIILYSSKVKAIIFDIICIFFVIISFIADTNNLLLTLIGRILFSLGVIIFTYKALRPSTLKLSRKGFEMISLGRKTFVSWNKIDNFTIASLPIPGSINPKTLVGFNYVSSDTENKIGKTVAWELSGVEGVLPDNYGKTNEELVTLLNEWKKYYSDTI